MKRHLADSRFLSKLAAFSLIGAVPFACSSGVDPAATDEPSAGSSSTGTGGRTNTGGGKNTGGSSAQGGTANGTGGSGAGTSESGGSTGTTGGSNSGSGGSGGNPTPEGTPVAINGKLHVCDKTLCNEHDKPIQLRGMSTHGIQWYGWGKCINDSSLDALANEWGADLLRVSLYVQEGGYESNPDGFTKQAETIIDAAIKRGLYVIIDWHMLTPGDPRQNTELAKKYFSHMTTKYANSPNVLYEIANEPNGDDVNWPEIKEYADEIIPVIRKNDPDSIVLIGTPDWSSFGGSGEGNMADDIVANKPAFDNLMYTFHFYAKTHGEYYRTILDDASNKLPVFVTEWGSQEASGDGPNDFDSAQKYIDMMRQKKISWASWNYSDDERTGAVFVRGTCSKGPWTGDKLKEAGTWVQNKIKDPADDFPVN